MKKHSWKQRPPYGNPNLNKSKKKLKVDGPEKWHSGRELALYVADTD